MDIPKLSMAMAHNNLMQQWSIGIMKHALEMTDLQAEVLTDMLADMPIPADSTFSVKI